MFLKLSYFSIAAHVTRFPVPDVYEPALGQLIDVAIWGQLILFSHALNETSGWYTDQTRPVV